MACRLASAGRLQTQKKTSASQLGRQLEVLPLTQSFVHIRDEAHPYWEGKVLCLIYQSNLHLVQSCRYRHISKQVARFWLCDPVK